MTSYWAISVKLYLLHFLYNCGTIGLSVKKRRGSEKRKYKEIKSTISIPFPREAKLLKIFCNTDWVDKIFLQSRKSLTNYLKMPH